MTLDVFSDLACPWCSIGEAHLRAALRQRPGLEAVVRWRPFQLQPGIPPEGLPLRPFFVDKFGGEAAMERAFAQVARAGAAAGVPFDFSRLSGAPNTADAHRLVLLGAEHGRTWEVARALFDGYFAHGRDLSSPEALEELASGAGLDAAEVSEVLDGDRFREEVSDSQRAAAALGVRGVPFVVIDGRYGVSGAQPPEAFLQAFATAAAA
jgi:predicted DsbA family dithiol-disulfide isomerase